LLSLTLGCSKQETPKGKPSPTPTPLSLLPRKEYETARLFNGILVKSSVKVTPSEESALSLEKRSESYTLELTLRLQVPAPATTATNLLAATPDLAELLPNLDSLLTNASASPDYATLFDYKEKNLRANLNTLQRLQPLDTLYDCQTILNLQNPTTARRALLIQALMNVNTDGSDGDRNLDLDSSSAFFQPQTNYRSPARPRSAPLKNRDSSPPNQRQRRPRTSSNTGASWSEKPILSSSSPLSCFTARNSTPKSATMPLSSREGSFSQRSWETKDLTTKSARHPCDSAKKSMNPRPPKNARLITRPFPI
jgi:hypothetical protein